MPSYQLDLAPGDFYFDNSSLGEFHIFSFTTNFATNCCSKSYLQTNVSAGVCVIRRIIFVTKCDSGVALSTLWGTLIYVRQGLSAQRQYEELDIPSDVYKIAGKGLRSFILINNYRQCDSTDAWIHTYSNLLQKLAQDFPGLSVYSVGDFNTDLSKDNPHAQKLVDLFTSNGFVNLVKKPTRITRDSATLIDHVSDQ